MIDAFRKLSRSPKTKFWSCLGIKVNKAKNSRKIYFYNILEIN